MDPLNSLTNGTTSAIGRPLSRANLTPRSKPTTNAYITYTTLTADTTTLKLR
jgi:hypothetical protein